jgi:hypothetical protein
LGKNKIEENLTMDQTKQCRGKKPSIGLFAIFVLLLKFDSNSGVDSFMVFQT